MRVAFDTVILGAYLHPTARYPTPVDRVPERLRYLVERLDESDATIVIPTPALSEFLAFAASDGPKYLAILANSSVFNIEPFDQRAAVEAAASQARAVRDGDKKGGAVGSWQKVKVDRQIAAIAKVSGVDELYSEDGDVRRLATSMGVLVKGVAGLPLPPGSSQLTLPHLQADAADPD